MISSKVIVDLLSLLSSGPSPSMKRSILSHYHSLIINHPEIEWLFVLENKDLVPPCLSDLPGVSFIRFKKWPGWFGWSLWYGFHLPALLRKHKADLFFGWGSAVNMKKERIRQVIWLPGKSGFSTGGDDRFYQFCHKRLKITLSIAELGYVISPKTRDILCMEWPDLSSALRLIGNFGKPMPSLDSDQKKEAKTKFTGGREYFICFPDGDESEIICLLKAFSIFKKRQQTNMLLILAGDKRIEDKLRSYAYREEVRMIGEMKEEEYRFLLAGAYALIDLGSELPSDIFYAFQAGLPVIASGKEPLNEEFEPALFKAVWQDPQSLAREFMTVYTNERLRFSRIEIARHYLAVLKNGMANPGEDDPFGLLREGNQDKSV